MKTYKVLNINENDKTVILAEGYFSYVAFKVVDRKNILIPYEKLGIGDIIKDEDLSQNEANKA